MSGDKKGRYNKDAMPIGGILSSAITRHGIAWQIQAAMTVKKANEILNNIIDPNVRNDIRVISFAKNQLTIVCRHSAASNLGYSIRAQLQDTLEIAIPEITIKNMYFKINPHLLDSGSEIH